MVPQVMCHLMGFHGTHWRLCSKRHWSVLKRSRSAEGIDLKASGWFKLRRSTSLRERTLTRFRYRLVVCAISES